MNKLRKENEFNKFLSWFDEKLQNGETPRVLDAFYYAKKQKWSLSKPEVSRLMRQNPRYENTLHQQRAVHRYRKWRPISVEELGHWHGDLGYFPIVSTYATPKKYRAGFLVMTDVLSRKVWLTPLHFKKDAKQLQKAIERLLDRHQESGADYSIKSISFDKEAAIMGKQIQKFLREKGIQFVFFEHSASKSKFAENAIGRIRSKEAILNKPFKFTIPWWIHLKRIEGHLNDQPVAIDGIILHPDITPNNVTNKNKSQFLDLIYNIAPAYKFAQFELNPELCKFKFEIGTFVKAKLIITSSAVLGIKRSATRLTPDTFQIIKRQCLPFRNLEVGIVYLCKNLRTRRSEKFDENDLVPVVFTPQTERDAVDNRMQQQIPENNLDLSLEYPEEELIAELESPLQTEINNRTIIKRKKKSNQTSRGQDELFQQQPRYGLRPRRR